MAKQTPRFFLKNRQAVIDMPLRLTVTIVIGTLVLIAILTYMNNTTLIAEEIIVEIDTYSVEYQDNNSFQITVTDTQHQPLCDCLVIIKGLGQITSNRTDTSGLTTLKVSCSLNATQQQGYLDVIVKPPDGYRDYQQDEFIKVYRR